jgi:hypothetical protein
MAEGIQAATSSGTKRGFARLRLRIASRAFA